MFAFDFSNALLVSVNVLDNLKLNEIFFDVKQYNIEKYLKLLDTPPRKKNFSFSVTWLYKPFL